MTPRQLFGSRRTLRALRLALTASAFVLVAACETQQPPPPPTGPEVLDVEGLWLVEPGPGTYYGTGGTTTLEFGAASSGSADFLNRADASHVLTCEKHVYAAIAEDVLMLDGTHYVAQTNGQDEIVLSNETDMLTLTRISGAPPFEPCLEAEATDVKTFSFGVGGWTSLTAIGSKLYFNTDATDNPIVGFDTTTEVLGPARINPGNHDHLVAARTDDQFYGNCACGNVTTLQRFDINNPTALATVSTQNDLGVFMSAEHGFFDGSSVHLTGRDYANQGVNHVLRLNPDTLALQSQRTVLQDAFISDIAWTGSQLVALVGNSIAYIGNDGMAEATLDLPSNVPSFPSGLAVSGGDFYVLGENADDEAVLVQIPMP